MPFNPADHSGRRRCHLGDARILVMLALSLAVALNTQDNLFFGIADYYLDSPICLSAFGRVVGGHGP